MEFVEHVAEFVAHATPSTSVVFTHDRLVILYETFRASRSLRMAPDAWIQCLLNSNRLVVVRNSPLSYSWIQRDPPRTLFKCSVCVLEFSSQERYNAHTRTEGHLAALQATGRNADLIDKYAHLRGALEVGTGELESANNISITPESFESVVSRNVAGQVEFKVANNGQTALVTCGFAEPRSGLTLPLTNFTIPAGASESIIVRYNPPNLGSLHTLLVFNFNSAWAAFRKISLDVHGRFDDPDIEELKPTAPYRRPTRLRIAHADHIVPGEPRPSEGGGPSFRRPLPASNIPREFKVADFTLKEYFTRKGLIDTEGRVNLTARTYSDVFSALLFVEELQLNEDIL